MRVRERPPVLRCTLPITICSRIAHVLEKNTKQDAISINVAAEERYPRRLYIENRKGMPRNLLGKENWDGYGIGLGLPPGK